MDIQPTTVEVKDIIITNTGSYGGEVTFQVVGYTSATAPLRVPLQILKAFAEKIGDINPLMESGIQGISIAEPIMVQSEEIS